MISPWISPNTVIHEPNEEQSSGETGCRWEHSSLSSSLKHLFNLPDFLTRRDAWAAHWDSTIVNESTPRTDCPTEIPVPGTAEQKAQKKIELTTELTDELLKHYEETGNISTDTLSDLQYEILTIAKGLTNSDFDVYSLKTEHEGAVYVRSQLKAFFAQGN